MSREIKFRVWNEREKTYEDGWNYFISDDGQIYALKYGALVNMSGVDYLKVEYSTGLKDKNGDKEIYEYDIIDGEGNIIGNYHETPELLKDKTNLLIQGFGTKTWLTTYQEAVERGCHDA